QTDILAASGTVSSKAKITLKWISTRISTDDGSSAPADSANRFAGTSDPSLAPRIVYPLDGALVPQNLGELEVQWTRPAAPADLFEVSFQGPFLELRVYTNAKPPGGGRLSLLGAEWNALAGSVAGSAATVGVRAVLSSDPTRVGSASPVQLGVGRDP